MYNVVSTECCFLGQLKCNYSRLVCTDDQACSIHMAGNHLMLDILLKNLSQVNFFPTLSCGVRQLIVCLD